jgi:2-polyprenyl-3-methyl-5-hydroxy-6-metoxy-1,4-benzoquinol methylase
MKEAAMAITKETKREFVPIEERYNPKVKEENKLTLNRVQELMANDLSSDWKTKYNNDYMRLQYLAGEMDYKERKEIVIDCSRFKWLLKKIDKEDKILDVGCSEGLFLAGLKENDYNNLVGIDVSDKAIEVAKANNKEVDFYCLKGEEMDQIDDDVFDTVFCLQVLEHVPKPLELLKGLFKVCKPGGQVIVGVPIEECLDDPLHLHHFDYYDVMHMFEEFTDDFKIYHQKKLPSHDENTIFMVIAKKEVDKNE